ncbi:NLRC5, partial [Symbiodinium sp. KB8]
VYCDLGWGDAAAADLSLAVQACHLLVNIELEGNGVADEGCRVLFEAFAACSSLAQITLRSNRVGDVGARHIAEQMPRCLSMEELDLSFNKIANAPWDCRGGFATFWGWLEVSCLTPAIFAYSNDRKVLTPTLPSMFHSVLLTSAWLLLAQGQTCEDSQDVSFLQHALKIGDLGAEVATSAATSPKIATHSLFVKFHKVAGSTWRGFVDEMTGETQACSGNCGNTKWICDQQLSESEPKLREWCYQTKVSWLNTCDRPMHTCTFHQSLEIVREAVSGKTLTLANSSDLAAVSNLWPDKKRLNLLWGVEWARVWLPGNFQNKRILVTTLLREPKERIRSFYYFKNSAPTREGFKAFLEFRRDFVLGNMTQERYEAEKGHQDRAFTTMSLLLRSCCEYETWLGDGSVAKAKLVLSTQFDLVGITERMNDALVSLGRLYGLSAEETARIGLKADQDKLDNSENKLDWTDEELNLTTLVAEKGTQIYDFGQELFERQSVSLFGTYENLRAAVETFEKMDPESLE